MNHQLELCITYVREVAGVFGGHEYGLIKKLRNGKEKFVAVGFAPEKIAHNLAKALMANGYEHLAIRESI